MIEQQAPKQSIRAKFFFKGLFVLIQWLFIIFLAFFFIAGLILQAPRKVLTLIIVILTTLTIIPRLIRKWVWLTFGIIVVALAIWVFLPDDNEGWKPYTFDEESAALRAKYAVPDEQNAAIVYNKLLETYDGDKYLAPNLGKVLSEGIEDVNSVNTVELLGGKIVKGTFYPDFWNSQLTRMTLNNFWSSSDYPDIATWLNEKHTTTLQMLMHASSFDKYFSPFSPEEECKRCLFADSIDRISPFKHWSHLIIIAANNDVGNGHLDKAFKKYRCALKMSCHLHQQPMKYYMLAGMATHAIAINRLQALIAQIDLSDSQLDLIEQLIAIPDFNWDQLYPIITDTRRIVAKRSILAGYEVNDQGKVKLAKSPLQITADEMKDYFGLSSSDGIAHGPLQKIVRLFNWFWVPSFPDEAASVVDDVFRGYANWTRSDWQKNCRTFLNIPAPFNYRGAVHYLYGWSTFSSRIFDIRDRHMSNINATYLIITLSRYKSKNGNWPQVLNEIKSMVSAEIFIDPVNDGEFVYKPVGDSFTLYSRGKNGIDENGKRDIKAGADDKLIWPREILKNEENTNGE